MPGKLISSKAKKSRIAFISGLAVGIVLSQLFGFHLGDVRHCRPIRCIANGQDSDIGARDFRKGVESPFSESALLERRLRPDDTARAPYQPRKILLDCGANVASTVQLFRETYPGGKDFLIHSFELDHRLAPYFSPYSNHVLHCPVAVSDKDVGRGSLFVSGRERSRKETGGKRLFSYRYTVPTIDLSKWIQENTNQEDYVIFKLDVEGAEFDILKKMLADGTFKWVDKYYGEFHLNQAVKGWGKTSKKKLIDELKSRGIASSTYTPSWSAETRHYKDVEDLHPPGQIPKGTPGEPGGVYSSCSASPPNTPRLTLAVQVGMNAKTARKLVTTLAAHPGNVPLALFVYGDFVELFPGLNQPFPPGHFALQKGKWIRYSLISAMERHRDAGLQPAYYLPDSLTDTVVRAAKSRGLRLVQPTSRFPPTQGMFSYLHVENYYNYRDVERVPKAERVLIEQLGDIGGILCLDSDHPDSYMVSVFLLDYLVQKSHYEMSSSDDSIGF
uniref:Methyltransferase FkbM domain-containing protein n=1 Tax=Branchiostoma floridae TaxID=7739 RepID=C3XQL1_BRAFL|eukprot:XP_002613668.1 hypothetical protein BRAFLDRAFT_66533 [Branchiostoma floridae]